MAGNFQSIGYIDLHTHTTASDGSFSPSELVREAKRQGLSAVAVTDHDTVDGVEEAMEAGQREGVEVVPGVEISLDYKGEMHVLGYYYDMQSESLRSFLKDLIASREQRNPKIAAALREMGIDITLDEVIAEAEGGIVGRPHFAKVLMKKGYVKSVEDAFDKYLGDGAKAYIKKEKFSPREGIEAIRRSDGIPVLAHPKYLNLGGKQLDELLEELKSYGLMGIEAYYTTHTVTETGNYLRLAIKHDLLVTGGSDFHGSTKPNIELGKGAGNLKVEYSLLEGLKQKRKECSRQNTV